MNTIYNEVATRYNTTPAEVESEIAYALSLAKRNPSPVAQAFWGRFKDGADITDVICNIVSTLASVV